MMGMVYDASTAASFGRSLCIEIYSIGVLEWAVRYRRTERTFRLRAPINCGQGGGYGELQAFLHLAHTVDATAGRSLLLQFCKIQPPYNRPSCIVA